MNYQKIYDSLISKRKEHPLEKGIYSEKHHIIPKSINPSLIKEKTNIIKLTAREHFIAHLLLIKIYEKQNNKDSYIKAVLAVNLMINKNSKRYEWKDICLYSKKYEYLRLKAANAISLNTKKWMENNKEKISGKNNGAYNTMWIKNLSTNENKKIKKDEPIPNGWVKGMYVSSETIKKQSDAYKPIKRMWIRKKDLTEQKLVPIDIIIPKGWEKGSSLKFSKEQKQKISERNKFSKEYYENMKTFLLPIYKEYQLHPSKEMYLDLQKKFNLQKWSWNNFLGKCKKYCN